MDSETTKRGKNEEKCWKIYSNVKNFYLKKLCRQIKYLKASAVKIASDSRIRYSPIILQRFSVLN